MPSAFPQFGRATRAYVSAYQRDRVHLCKLRALERRILIADFSGTVPAGSVLGATTWSVLYNDAVSFGTPVIEGLEAGIPISGVMPGTCLVRVDGTLSTGDTYSQLFELELIGPYFTNDGTQSILQPGNVTTTLPNDIAITGDAPDATEQAAYSYTYGYTGTAYSPVWSIEGALPIGLSLDPQTGTISGTPTTAGTFNFTIRITDVFSRGASLEQSIQVDFSAGIVYLANAEVNFYSGSTDTFPLIQNVLAPSTTKKALSANRDATRVVIGTDSTVEILRRTTPTGPWAFVPSALSPAVTNTNAVAMDRTGDYLFVSDITTSTHRFYKWNGSTYAQIASFGSRGGNNDARWSPDGQYLAVCTAAPNQTNVYRRIGDVITELTVPATGLVRGIAWNDDSNEFVLGRALGTAGMFLLGVSGDTVSIILTSGVSQPENPMVRWSKDRSFVFVAGNTPAPRIRVFQFTGFDFVPFGSDNTLPNPCLYLDLSEDGRLLIACGSGASPNYRIFLVNNGVLTLVSTSTIPLTLGGIGGRFFRSSDFFSP